MPASYGFMRGTKAQNGAAMPHGCRRLARAASGEIAKAYDEATGEARALGIFEVPTFVSGGEIFCGDDRLDDAIRWRRAQAQSSGNPA